MKAPPREYGVYLHLPWCRSRCPYCAFNVRVDPVAPTAAYTEALIRQWAAVAPRFEGRPATLFFGGGTPSLHPPDQLARLVATLDPAPGAEVTREANPGTLTPALLEALLEAGISRLSVGVQTFQPRLARLLNRGHTVTQSRDLLAMVAAAGFRSWSLDLIFAVPGQSLDDLRRDLEAALSLSPPHLSIYGLSAEPGTPYTRAVEAGRLSPPDEETWEAMYELLVATLEGAGLGRYEISNFARPGHRCRHNEHYYRGRPYAGLGAGAHGWAPDGERTVGLEDPAAFIADPLAWQSAERPSPRERALDLLISTLRHVDGVPLPALEAAGFRLAGQALRPLLEDGLIDMDPGAIRLQGRGWRVADGVLYRLGEALELLPEVP
jgi:putative oxygen-independent coproporphyrinogen III oxidase